MVSIIAITKKAYADTQLSYKRNPSYSDRIKEEKAYKERNLHWNGTPYVTVARITSAIKTVKQYNDFNPNKVILALKSLGDIRVKLAREGSPALYIKCGKVDPHLVFAKMKEVYADEVDIQKSGIVRAWWD